MADRAVKIENLSLTIDGKAILREISFDLAPGETLVLMGKNGSGKTMLLKTLVGLFRPQTGSAEILGQNVHKLAHGALAPCLQFVAQQLQACLPYGQ